jgi:ankyrin repeat protein
LHLFVAIKPSNDQIATFYQVLEKMRNSGVNVNLPDVSEETPLHSSCLSGCEKSSMWLIHHGAEVNNANK